MTTAGPNFAGAGADDATVGTIVWNSPGSITAEDSLTASATSLSATSHYLVASGFGFSIPAGSTINGITVEWRRNKNSTATTIVDNAIRIVQGGVIGATDKSSATGWPSGVLTYATYGGASDLWGLAWTSADINSSSFGAALSCKKTAGKTKTAAVDACRITIDYTAGGGGSTQSEFSTRVIPAGPHVGPQVLRQGWRQSPPLPLVQALATDTEFGSPTIRLPNPLVGPPALRRNFRGTRYPFDSTVSVVTTNRIRRVICSGA